MMGPAGQKASLAGRSTSPVWRILAFVMAPNLVMIGFDRLSSGSRPALFDLDYALIPVLHAVMSIFGWRRIATVTAIFATLIVMAADLFTTVTQIYFAGPAMLLDYLPFLSLWPWRWIGAILLVLAAAATLLVRTTLEREPQLGRVLTSIAALTVGLILLDALAARLEQNYPAIPNIASSGVTEALRPSVGQAIDELRGETTRLEPSRTPTLASMIRASSRPPARILSVAVESWGRLRDQHDDALMVAPLFNGLHSQYRIVEAGTHPFYGATLAGEVRELCGLKQTGGVPRGADQYAQLRACLPAQLARRGYLTVALHGNAGAFYRRNRFYPMMGFAEHWHYEQMRPQVATLCNFLFVGICDRDSARIALGAFDGRPRAFVHLMTLDTHLPLPAPTGACRAAAEPSLCAYTHAISASLEAVATAVGSARTPPDLIVLYGDHAPPFVERRLRDRFEEGKVPFLVFLRRG
jgi:phosphoglycerol transferase MdoB-like AlkP superfamily enzyme